MVNDKRNNYHYHSDHQQDYSTLPKYRIPHSLSLSNKRKRTGKSIATGRGGVITYDGEEFEDGYLMKDFRVTALLTKDVNPTLEEITKFAAGTDDSEGIDLSSLA